MLLIPHLHKKISTSSHLTKSKFDDPINSISIEIRVKKITAISNSSNEVTSSISLLFFTNFPPKVFNYLEVNDYIIYFYNTIFYKRILYYFKVL